ncbi:lipopolysaccharide heptosyltransferase II [Candidatus Omnitrophota bacterium]
MNILQVLPELNVGGVETGTLDLAKYLIKAGDKAVVVSAGGTLVKELESFGALHYQLPVHRKSIASMIKTVPRLAEVIRKEKIDIVHARSRVPAWIAYFACRRSGAVLITTCHGYYSRHLFSRVMGWGKRVIVLSNVIGRHMIDDFGVSRERIRLVSRSVDLSRFRFISPDKKDSKEFNVGIVGRITPIKGHQYFIKAMAMVLRSVPRLKVWIVGDAPRSKESYKEQVQVLVRRLGLGHYTEFLGNQRDIPAIMAHLDLLVLATVTHEAFGRVIVEAQACGVPVVATRVGGVVDIIEDGKNGILVPPGDAAAIAEAAMKIFKDKARAKRLANNAHKKVQEKFSVELMVSNTMQVYNDALSNFKILVIKLGSLGDLILSTAALRSIKERFGKDHKITLLVSQECKDAVSGCPYIDQLLVCDFKKKDKGARGLWKLGSRIRSEGFDLVIDLQNNRKSHILASLAAAPKRYGYRNKKLGFLLNRGIEDDMPRAGPLAHQFRILEPLGIGLNDPALELWPSENDAEYVDGLLTREWVAKGQRFIGINIGASRKWATKDWPLKHLVKLCKELSRRDLRVVITGTADDSRVAEELAKSVKSAKLINACAKTSINQLASLIKRCSVYISPDSAPMHIAASQNTPFVALFGPTDPARHIVPAERSIVIRKDLACSPCYKSKCKTVECMESISVEEVLEAVDKLIK